MVCDFQVRSLEAQGLPSKQAEAITGAITEVLNDSLGVVSQLVVSKGEMQKVSFCCDKSLLLHLFQRVGCGYSSSLTLVFLLLVG